MILAKVEYIIIAFHAGFHISRYYCGYRDGQFKVSCVVSESFEVIYLVGFGGIVNFAVAPASGSCHRRYAGQMSMVS